MGQPHTVNSAEDAAISCRKIENSRKVRGYRDLRYGKASSTNTEAPNWKPATKAGCTTGEGEGEGVVSTELGSQPSTVRTHAGEIVDICEWACSRRLRPAARRATTAMINRERSTASLARKRSGRVVPGPIASSVPQRNLPRFPEKFAGRVSPRCSNTTSRVAFHHHKSKGCKE
jgi:hypothetical protein